MRATLGHNFRFGYWEHTPLARMKAIRRAGFDDVMLWWGDEFSSTDGTPEQLHAMALDQGLSVHTVHFPIDTAHHLWLPGGDGLAYERALHQAVESCGAHGIAHLVVHATRRMITPPPNRLGAARLGRVLAAAEDLGVDIALENTRYLNYIQYLYDRLPSQRLKFCYDSGHQNCFTPGQDPLALFGHKLCTTHLHDNLGAQAGDQHLLMGEGTVDFDSVFQKLAALHVQDYNLESFASPGLGPLTMDQYLALSYRRLAAHVPGTP